jgi:hypothetical protein
MVITQNQNIVKFEEDRIENKKKSASCNLHKKSGGCRKQKEFS